MTLPPNYVSRAGWGARPYRLPGGATLYTGDRRGTKLHYLGGPYSDRAHGLCDDYVRTVQNLHMDDRGWSDIGYSFVVCTHGWIYEGRGLDRRNSANGNTTLNNQDYAILLLVGSSGLVKPTNAQLVGALHAIDYVRREGPAGSWLGGHRDGYATACPGNYIYAWIQAGAPSPEEEDMALTDDDALVVWHWDHVKAPTENPDNPNWAPASYLRNTYLGVQDARREIAALGTLDLTPEQLNALADRLAANPALVEGLAENIAEKVAAKVAARMAQ